MRRQGDIPRPRWLRGLYWCAVGLPATLLLVVSFCALALAVVLQDRTLPIPKPLVQDLLSRATAELGGMPLSVRDAAVGLGDRFEPFVRVSQLRIDPAPDAPPMVLAEAQVGLSLRSLLTRTPRPTTVAVSGGVYRVRRDTGGNVRLGLTPPSGDTQTGAVEEVVSVIEGVFDQPPMQDFRRLTITDIAVTYDDARTGIHWTADGGRVTLDKTAVGGFDLNAELLVLTGGAVPGALRLDVETGRGDVTISGQIDTLPPTDLAQQFSAIDWLTRVDAPASVQFRSVGPLGGQPVVNAALQLGAGHIMDDSRQPIAAFNGADIYVRYDTTQPERLDVIHFDIDTEWGRAEGGGAVLFDDAGGTLKQMQVQTQVSHLTLTAPTSLTLHDIESDLNIRFDPLEIDLTQASLRYAGATVQASGQFVPTEGGWDITTDLGLDHIDIADVVAPWPLDRSPRMRTWLADNVPTGTVQNLNVYYRALPALPPTLSAKFAFSDTTVQFLGPIPPLQQAQGVARLENDQFNLRLDQAVIVQDGFDPIDLAGSTLFMPNTTVAGPPVALDIGVKADVPAILNLLNGPPFGVMDRAKRPVDLITGRAEGRLRLAFRVKSGITADEITYQANVALRQIRSDGLIPNQTLRADLLDMTVTRDAVQVSGAVQVGQVPADMVWTLPIGPDFGQPARVQVRFDLNQDTFETFNIPVSPDFISGTSKADFEMTLKAGVRPAFRLTSDLVGTRMDVPAVGFAKAAGTPASLELAGTLGRVPEISTFSFTSPDLITNGNLNLTQDGQLSSITLRDTRLGGWLSSPLITLTANGPEQPMTIDIAGGTVDLRKSPFGGVSKTGGGGQFPALSGRVDTLIITDKIRVQQADVVLQQGPVLQGNITGQLGRRASVNVLLSTDDMGPRIDINGTNAGAVMREAGILRQADGGTLTVKLRPLPGGGLRGTANITDTRIIDAPLMAELLSAVSLVGLIEQLSGDGLLMNEIMAEFDVKDGNITLYSASGIGPSFGLSLDGFINTKEDILDLQGVVSPFYFINSVGVLVSRNTGEGLIGINFTMKGPSDAPTVIANPLSILTPGIFREIFRRPPPEYLE